MRRHRAPAHPSPAGDSLAELEPVLLEAPTARAALDHARTATAALRRNAGEDLAELARVRTLTACLASRTYAASCKGVNGPAAGR